MALEILYSLNDRTERAVVKMIWPRSPCSTVIAVAADILGDGDAHSSGAQRIE
jgi:hypothetical protein